jgi:hypothetical protein
VGSEDIGEPLVNIKREIDDENLDIDNGIGGMSTTMTLGIKTMTNNNTIPNNTEGLDCVVCGDRATGKTRSHWKWFDWNVYLFRKTLWSYIMRWM